MIAESVESDLDSPILTDVASGLPDIQLHSEDSGTDAETKSCLPDPRHDTDTNTKLHSLVDKEDVVRTGGFVSIVFFLIFVPFYL